MSRMLVEGVLLASEFYNGVELVNSGNGFEMAICEPEEHIKKLTNYKG